MKVYITSTNDFPIDKLSEIVSTLKDINGVIKFVFSKSLTLKQQERFLKKSKEQIQNLKFDDFFGLCDDYRILNEEFIEDDDFVVVISDIPHEDRWFSAFRGKNIFVDGLNWNLFSNKDSKYGIAFQIAENIFQSLIDLKIEGDLDPLIHRKSIGCVNDMCFNKEEIKLKFFAGHICDKCYNVGKEKIHDQFILNHLENIFSQLRNEFVKRGESPNQYIPLPKVVNENQIKIGSVEFKPQPIEKSIYIYFIENRDGVETIKIQDKADEIYQIYRRVRKSAELIKIANVFGYKVTPSNNLSKTYNENHRFEEIRSNIKRKLKELLGEDLSNKYLIEVTKLHNDYNSYVLKCYL